MFFHEFMKFSGKLLIFNSKHVTENLRNYRSLVAQVEDSMLTIGRSKKADESEEFGTQFEKFTEVQVGRSQRVDDDDEKEIENKSALNKFKSNLTQFVFHFNKWKSEDLEILKQQLFNEYHQLTIDILDTNNEDKKRSKS